MNPEMTGASVANAPVISPDWTRAMSPAEIAASPRTRMAFAVVGVIPGTASSVLAIIRSSILLGASRGFLRFGPMLHVVWAMHRYRHGVSLHVEIAAVRRPPHVKINWVGGRVPVHGRPGDRH